VAKPAKDVAGSCRSPFAARAQIRTFGTTNPHHMREPFWEAMDFCIYNDVFVHGGDDSIVIFGYPEAIFGAPW
jgi:hypothetical protein